MDDNQIQRLDFTAPILSVRRIATSPKPSRTGPFVPFTWEQTPGRPKPVQPDPVRSAQIDDSSSSSTSSDGSLELPRGSGRFRKDPETGAFMMGRFLAAAKAAVDVGPTRDDGGYRRMRKTAEEEEETRVAVTCRLDRRLVLFNPVAACVDARRELEQNETEHSWDAVYKHKLGCENLVLREDRSKVMSESNRLTYWTESLSPDGSSPYFGKGWWKSGSFDSFDKSGEINFDRTSSYDKQRESVSMSPSADTTLYMESIQLTDTPNSKSSSVDEFGRVHPECYIVEQGLLSCSADEACDKPNENSDTGKKLSLLPPPLPSSPSESWLHRTLPSVSSKNPPPRSLLGFQVQHRKQPSRTYDPEQ